MLARPQPLAIGRPCDEHHSMPPYARRTRHSPNAVSAARRVRPYSKHTAKAATLAALALVGCRGPGAGSPAHAAEPMGEAAAVARASADSARYPYTEADIRFMSGMIHHHAQAIKMARWAPTHGASAAVIRLTERIINAQTDEITLMSNWLSARRQPVPQPNPDGMTMSMGGEQHVMLMPGMLSAAQMASTRSRIFQLVRQHSRSSFRSDSNQSRSSRKWTSPT